MKKQVCNKKDDNDLHYYYQLAYVRAQFKKKEKSNLWKIAVVLIAVSLVGIVSIFSVLFIKYFLLAFTSLVSRILLICFILMICGFILKCIEDLK